MGTVTQIPEIHWGSSFIRRDTERAPVFYNPSLSWGIIRVLSHWLGYSITCVAAGRLVFLVLTENLICCVTFVRMA